MLIVIFYRIKRVVHSGLMQKWKRMFWPTDDECTAKIRGTTGSVNTLVTVRDMQGSFFILFIGVFISVYSTSKNYYV